jgi:hypothetical protein
MYILKKFWEASIFPPWICKGSPPFVCANKFCRNKEKIKRLVTFFSTLLFLHYFIGTWFFHHEPHVTCCVPPLCGRWRWWRWWWKELASSGSYFGRASSTGPPLPLSIVEVLLGLSIQTSIWHRQWASFAECHWSWPWRIQQTARCFQTHRWWSSFSTRVSATVERVQDLELWHQVWCQSLTSYLMS